jgi:hypothetical protein
MAGMMMQVNLPILPTEASRLWRVTKGVAWALFIFHVGVPILFKISGRAIFMDTAHIPHVARTFHINHPWSRKAAEDIIADYSSFQETANISFKTLKTARVASVKGHVLGNAWVLHPPGANFPSRRLFPEGADTGHEREQAPPDHQEDGIQQPPPQPVTRPGVLQITSANVLDGGTVGASWTPPEIQCGVGQRTSGYDFVALYSPPGAPHHDYIDFSPVIGRHESR